MKKILALLFVPLSVFSMDLWQSSDNSKTIIDSSSVHTPYNLQDTQLYHSKNKGFVVLQGNKKHIVESFLMDKASRDMDREGLKYFLKSGYFALNQTNDGSFTLKAHQRLEGGGVIGASIGAFVGKIAVSVAGHGTLYLIALSTGPAFPVTLMALEGAFGPAIEAASIKGAIAGGVIGGVATGPV